MKEFFKKRWVKWLLMWVGSIVVVGTGILGYLYWQIENSSLKIWEEDGVFYAGEQLDTRLIDFDTVNYDWESSINKKVNNILQETCKIGRDTQEVTQKIKNIQGVAYVEVGRKQHRISLQYTDRTFTNFSLDNLCITDSKMMVLKPIIYLYPTQPTKVNVQLDYQGTLTVTYPQISPQNDRTVFAQPDGTLINEADGLEYSYLFREGENEKPYTIKEGFVVKNEDTIAFLQDKLAYLWLTPREYNEFIVYWRPKMKENQRNLISFLGDAYTSQAELVIIPQPDSIQRVFMVFQWLNEPIEFPKQTLSPFERNGFSVIERGGSELN